MKNRVVLAVPVLLVPILFPVLLLSLIAGFGAKSPALACDTGPPPAGAEAVGDAQVDAEQMQVATQIVGAVRAFPATADKPHAAVVALATARQESGIRNLDYGDRDSLGAFQQRPSQGWGTPGQVRNVGYATTAFLKRLVQVPGWETMRVTDAAATVQRPAEEYRGLYEQWVPLATALTERLWGTAPGVVHPIGAAAATSAESVTIAHANMKVTSPGPMFRADLHTAVATGPDLVSLNEVSSRSDRELAPPGYALWRDPNHGPDGTAVLWRTDRWTQADSGGVVMVDRGPPKWDHDRAATWVTVHSSVGAQVSMVSVDDRINPAKYGPNQPLRQRLYRQGMEKLQALITTLSARGPVLVAGDFTSEWADNDPWGPRAMLGAIGMKSTTEPLGKETTHDGAGIIDHIFYQADAATPTTQATQNLNSDHHLITATLSLTGNAAATGIFAQSADCVGVGGSSVPANCSARGGAAEAGLTPDALSVMRCALTVFGPHVVGGVGERPNPTDHTTGRAVDFMIAGWDTPAGNAEGWEIAFWAQDNAKQLGVTYVIFDAKIWSPDRNAEGWRPYTHPTGSSNPTLDHLDHVHVSVHGQSE